MDGYGLLLLGVFKDCKLTLLLIWVFLSKLAGYLKDFLGLGHTALHSALLLQFTWCWQLHSPSPQLGTQLLCTEAVWGVPLCVFGLSALHFFPFSPINIFPYLTSELFFLSSTLVLRYSFPMCKHFHFFPSSPQYLAKLDQNLFFS